jgi:hypothetical protein
MPRTREEVEEDARSAENRQTTWDEEAVRLARLQVELLLDIRDALDTVLIVKRVQDS